MRGFRLAAGMLMAAASAQANIVITEIWAGGLDGAEATADWFELTNYGAGSVDPSGWFYDDDSADPTKDDPVLGLSPIAPGESVIVLVSWDDDWATAGDAITAFTGQWNVSNSLAGVQVGYVDGGSGLGGGGDAAYIFDGNQVGSATIASQIYISATTEASFVSDGNGNWNNDQLAVDGVLGAYQSNFGATDLLGPAVGSPGVVPEPSTFALMGLSLLALRRRR